MTTTTTTYPYQARTLSKFKNPPGSSPFSFKPGQTITVLAPAPTDPDSDDDDVPQQADQSGQEEPDWLMGKNEQGQQGIFPTGLIERLLDNDDDVSTVEHTAPTQNKEDEALLDKKKDFVAPPTSAPTSSTTTTTTPAISSPPPLPTTAIPSSSPAPLSTPTPISTTTNTTQSIDSETPPAKPQSLKDRIAALNLAGAGAAGPPSSSSSKPSLPPPTRGPKPTFVRKTFSPSPSGSLDSTSGVGAGGGGGGGETTTTAGPMQGVERTTPSASSASNSGFSAADALSSVSASGGGSLKDRIKALSLGGGAAAPPVMGGPKPPKPKPKPKWEVKEEVVVKGEGEEGEEEKEIVYEKRRDDEDVDPVLEEKSTVKEKTSLSPSATTTSTTSTATELPPTSASSPPPSSAASPPPVPAMTIQPLPKRAGPPKRSRGPATAAAAAAAASTTPSTPSVPTTTGTTTTTEEEGDGGSKVDDIESVISDPTSLPVSFSSPSSGPPSSTTTSATTEKVEKGPQAPIEPESSEELSVEGKGTAEIEQEQEDQEEKGEEKPKAAVPRPPTQAQNLMANAGAMAAAALAARKAKSAAAGVSTPSSFATASASGGEGGEEEGDVKGTEEKFKAPEKGLGDQDLDNLEDLEAEEEGVSPTITDNDTAAESPVDEIINAPPISLTVSSPSARAQQGEGDDDEEDEFDTPSLPTAENQEQEEDHDVPAARVGGGAGLVRKDVKDVVDDGKGGEEEEEEEKVVAAEKLADEDELEAPRGEEDVDRLVKDLKAEDSPTAGIRSPPPPTRPVVPIPPSREVEPEQDDDAELLESAELNSGSSLPVPGSPTGAVEEPEYEEEDAEPTQRDVGAEEEEEVPTPRTASTSLGGAGGRPAIPRIPSRFAPVHGASSSSADEGGSRGGFVDVGRGEEEVTENAPLLEPKEQERGQVEERKAFEKVESEEGDEEGVVSTASPVVAAKEVGEPSVAPGEGEVQKEEEEEEEEEEDPEVARRRALAARMAKLGGMNMRMGPMIPPIGGMRKPTKQTSTSSAASTEAVADAPREAEEAPAPPRRLPGFPAGGVALPGIMPRPPPVVQKSIDDDEPTAASRTEEARMASPPPIPSSPPPIPSSAPPPPRRSVPVPAAAPPSPPHAAAGEPEVEYEEEDAEDEPEQEEGVEDEAQAPPLPPSRPPPTRYVAEPEETPERHNESEDQPYDQEEEDAEEEEEDEAPPPPPPRSAIPPTKRSNTLLSQSGEGGVVPMPRASFDESAPAFTPGESTQAPIQKSISRASAQSGFKARDLDLELGSKWWRGVPFSAPGGVKARRDAVFDVSEAVTTKRGKTTHSNQVEVIYDDFSKTIISVSFVEGDEASESSTTTSREHFPPPAFPSTAELGRYSSTIGAQILRAAESTTGSKLSDEGLISAALGGATDPLPPIGFTFGIRIFALSLDASSSKAKPVSNELDEIRPGDIAVLVETKFKTGLLSKNRSGNTGPHTGVVKSWDAKKRKLTLLEVGGKDGVVEEGSYKLEEMKQGSVAVYRVVERALLDTD